MYLLGTNLEHARGRNRRVAFEAVLKHGPMSRSEIARMTGLTPQTVSNITGELAGVGLIKEVGRRTGRKGQPAAEYTVDGEGGYTIGIHLDQHQVAGILVDVLGTIVKRTKAPLASQSPEDVLPLIEGVVDELAVRGSTERERMLGVGVVMPGFFDNGVFVSYGPLSMEGWLNIPVVERLSARLALPVFVENDATAAAMGEGLYGVGQRQRNFVYIYFGLGLGGGILVDGQPLSGAHHRAAELGHLVVNPGGKPCACGNHGCLERYVSLHSAYQSFLKTESEMASASPDVLLTAYEDGNPGVLKWLADAAHYLRLAVNTLENLLDPGGIVLGGMLPVPLIKALIADTQPLMPSVASRREAKNARLIAGSILFDTPAMGAAALPMANLLHPAPRVRGDQPAAEMGAVGLLGMLGAHGFGGVSLVPGEGC